MSSGLLKPIPREEAMALLHAEYAGKGGAELSFQEAGLEDEAVKQPISKDDADMLRQFEQLQRHR